MMHILFWFYDEMRWKFADIQCSSLLYERKNGLTIDGNNYPLVCRIQVK